MFLPESVRVCMRAIICFLRSVGRPRCTSKGAEHVIHDVIVPFNLYGMIIQCLFLAYYVEGTLFYPLEHLDRFGY